MSTVKIKLVISSESNTELFEEINRLPPRNRAERIRTLATIGLLKFSNDPNSQPEDQIQAKEKEEESGDELIRRKKHAMMVAKKLINNL